MAKKNQLVCTVARKPETITRDEPFRLNLKLENTFATTVHVSNQIQSLQILEDGKVVEVSTAKPQLAETVTVGILFVPTTPLAPNQSIDLELEVKFPLRLARFTGDRPRIEVEEWMPVDEVEIRTIVAFGEQPFYPPGDERRLNEALEKWTKTVRTESVRARVEAGERPKSIKIDDGKGE